MKKIAILLTTLVGTDVHLILKTYSTLSYAHIKLEEGHTLSIYSQDDLSVQGKRSMSSRNVSGFCWLRWYRIMVCMSEAVIQATSTTHATRAAPHKEISDTNTQQKRSDPMNNAAKIQFFYK